MRYWQRRFGGDAGVLGRDIRINGHVMTIVGVAQPGFNGVDLGAPVDLFVPLMMKPALTPTWNDLDSWRSRWVTVMGRLAPGVSHDRVAAALNVRYRQLLQEDVQTARLSGERARSVSPQESAGDRGRTRASRRSATSSRTPLVVVMAHGRPRADRRLRQRGQSDAGAIRRAPEGRRVAAGAWREPLADRASAVGGERRARGGRHGGRAC